MKIDQKFRNRLSILLKNNRLLFSRTIDYFPIVFGSFCDLIIPKKGIEMQIFFLNRLWRFLTLFPTAFYVFLSYGGGGEGSLTRTSESTVRIV